MPLNSGLLQDGLSRLGNATGAATAPTAVAAAGSTQAGATLIPTGPVVVRVTTTTSSEGVRLPELLAFVNTGATQITIIPLATIGNKVYPFAGQGINAVATNTALAVASAKPCTFYAGHVAGSSTALRWAAQKGG